MDSNSDDESWDDFFGEFRVSMFYFDEMIHQNSLSERMLHFLTRKEFHLWLF